jgi:hypothetical protein
VLPLYKFKAVLLNYVNYFLKDSHDSARRWGGESWVGINSPAQETDLLKLVEAAYQSGKSIEENFGLKILLKGRNEGLGYEEVTADKLQEPFIFISYEVGNLFPFISTEMKKVLFNELLPSELDKVRRKINFYTTLLGYGNHYYTIIPHAFSGKCCDSRTSYNSDSEEDKQMAFNAARRMLLNSKRQPIKWRIMVSNCGEIYITKDEGINLL